MRDTQRSDYLPKHRAANLAAPLEQECARGKSDHWVVVICRSLDGELGSRLHHYEPHPTPGRGLSAQRTLEYAHLWAIEMQRVTTTPPSEDTAASPEHRLLPSNIWGQKCQAIEDASGDPIESCQSSYQSWFMASGGRRGVKTNPLPLFNS